MKEVEYDEDGCYAPDQYMAAVTSGDVFQDYSFFIGNKYKFCKCKKYYSFFIGNRYKYKHK